MDTRAKVNPEMMKWARERAGFTNGFEDTLPGDIKSSYELWESGERSPTWKQLRHVSKRYCLPTAFFFRSHPIDFEEDPVFINYRKLDNLDYSNKSPDLIKNIRKSEIRRNIFVDLLDELNEDGVTFEKFSGKINKMNIINHIRKVLNVSLDEQKKLSKDSEHYSVLNFWKEKFNEKLGILIFETKNVTIEEMRALCIFYDKAPIILLNGKDSVNGRIFSLFHELTHLLLGESAICDEKDILKEEIFCNAVAGEFLVPSDDLNREYFEDFSDNALKKLSNLYGVSTYVIIRRLLDINKIRKQDYDSKVEEIGNNYKSKKKGSGGNHLNNQIKYYSKPYYRLVFDAYDRGKINLADFMNYTNLKGKDMPELQKRIYGGI
ncbi:MAG: ImmA/IrrE family metallo-endopeptidase [Methanobrevibacter sp.]|uniref:ImmA/IrrE family metallo-endopeptidase n=1 Tax=Methanobrevibacter sp. TaxID=66852 RepID=UPI0026DEE91F|nr:ImmA/IrrE family metallo-endopeptidase [Methanobrevibacter sp.]MDO5849265.1 ImmA/IrrE family metallo-endopeptidase [Methanobrevibacter sp.]